MKFHVQAQHAQALQEDDPVQTSCPFVKGDGAQNHQQSWKVCCVESWALYCLFLSGLTRWLGWIPRSGGPLLKSSAAYPRGYAVRLLEMHRPFMALASDIRQLMCRHIATPTPCLRPRAFWSTSCALRSRRCKRTTWEPCSQAPASQYPWDICVLGWSSWVLHYQIPIFFVLSILFLGL